MQKGAKMKNNDVHVLCCLVNSKEEKHMQSNEEANKNSSLCVH